jgi:hypothetical protein
MYYYRLQINCKETDRSKRYYGKEYIITEKFLDTLFSIVLKELGDCFF